jgi:hypothetical protein
MSSLTHARLHLLSFSSWGIDWWTMLITLVILLPNMYIQAQPISYERIDTHVLQTPNQMETSVQTLAAYLVKPARNEHEKVRAIFRWVTENIAYDTDGYFSGKYGDLSPDGVLKSRRAVCDGYAGLFDMLGEAAGLEVVKVIGYSKGYSYAVGDTYDRTTNHAWNAVMIDNQWHLLDATWGAGYLGENKKFVRKFQAYYFLTPPEAFIYDHLPSETRWQLLEQPVSSEDYAGFVFLRPAFFQTGLEIKSHRQSIIEIDDQVTVTLRAPDRAVLLAQLVRDDDKLDESYTFVQRQSGSYNIHAITPGPGQYVLRVYAKNRHDEGSYAWALDYRIKAAKGGEGGFPKAFATFSENGGYLHSPMRARLKRGSTQAFKIQVPGAEEVAVIMGDNWHHLKEEGDMFIGNIEIQDKHIRVFAKFPGDEQYAGLLEYAGS